MKKLHLLSAVILTFVLIGLFWLQVNKYSTIERAFFNRTAPLASTTVAATAADTQNKPPPSKFDDVVKNAAKPRGPNAIINNNNNNNNNKRLFDAEERELRLKHKKAEKQLKD